MLNALLRNYLHYKLFDQAEKLLTKTTFPEQASNTQLARYLYYTGRIKALQLEYTEAHRCLLQAQRKAPTNKALGFRLTVHKLGAIVQLAAFATLHRLDPAPSLTDLGYAISAMAWLAVGATLFLMARISLPGFLPPVAFAAFLATFAATLGRPEAAVSDVGATIPHAHVLLASAGLAALGLAGLAGFFFLLEHRALKQRRKVARRIPMPSLEASSTAKREPT